MERNELLAALAALEGDKDAPITRKVSHKYNKIEVNTHRKDVLIDLEDQDGEWAFALTPAEAVRFAARVIRLVLEQM